MTRVAIFLLSCVTVANVVVAYANWRKGRDLAAADAIQAARTEALDKRAARLGHIEADYEKSEELLRRAGL